MQNSQKRRDPKLLEFRQLSKMVHITLFWIFQNWAPSGPQWEISQNEVQMGPMKLQNQPMYKISAQSERKKSSSSSKSAILENFENR